MRNFVENPVTYEEAKKFLENLRGDRVSEFPFDNSSVMIIDWIAGKVKDSCTCYVCMGTGEDFGDFPCNKCKGSGMINEKGD